MQKISNLSCILSDLQAIYLFPGGFENPMWCQIFNPLNNSHTHPIPTPYHTYTIPTTYLPHTYPYLSKSTHTYPIPNTYFKVRIRLGAELDKICQNLTQLVNYLSEILHRLCHNFTEVARIG